jgi:hypothetical protein
VSFNGLSGNDYSFLTGEALNGQLSSNVTAAYPTYTNFSMYGQDTWRATGRTTITYGLRWDVNPAPTTRQGPKPFALSDDAIAGVTQNDPIYPTRWLDVAPRFGIAYLSDNTRGPEMLLRAGFGLFYDPGYGVVGGAFNGAPYTNVRTISEVKFPFSAPDLAPPGLPATRPYGQVTSGAAGFEVAGHLSVEWNPGEEFRRGASIEYRRCGHKGQQSYAHGNPAFVFRAYDLLLLTTNEASSSYNALQVQIRKRLSTTFQTQLSYTWSHSIDSASNDAGFGGGGFASLFGSGERGSSDYDIRQNLSFSGSWRLPSPGEATLFYPLRHWYLDFVMAARTGLPFDIQGVSAETSCTTSTTTSANCSNNVGLFAQVRPDWNGKAIWIYDPHVPGGKRLNSAAFFVPTGYEQGNLGRNSCRGFGPSQLDLSLRRTIPLRERWQLNVAAQGYNVLNHPNFANPSAMRAGISPVRISAS